MSAVQPVGTSTLEQAIQKFTMDEARTLDPVFHSIVGD